MYIFLLEPLSHIITYGSPLLAHGASNKAPSFIHFWSFNIELVKAQYMFAEWTEHRSSL